MAKTFHTVVFQAQEGGGNPCPITLDADGLTEQQMQQMTKDFGEESAFLMRPTRPDCDIKARYFVPLHEMEMCIHATIGAATVLVQQGIFQTSPIRFETFFGPVQVDWMRTEAGIDVGVHQFLPKFMDRNPSAGEVCRVLGIGPEELAKQMDPEIVKSTFATARETGGLIEITDNMNDIKDADVIYGDIWASMGEEELIPKRSELLSPYRVTEETLKATGNPEVLYMHCLPSFHDFETKLAKEWHDKGVDIREVTDEVFRGRHSVVFDEAENRMHTIKAVMVATIGK